MSSRVEFEQRSSAGGQVFFDRLETRTDAERAQDLARQLPIQVCAAREVSAFAERLREVDAASVTSREALALLPVTRKAELLERQRAGCRAPVAGSAIGSPSAGHASDEIATEFDPFGGFSAIGWPHLRGLSGARRGLPVAWSNLRTRRLECDGLLALGARVVCRGIPIRSVGS